MTIARVVFLGGVLGAVGGVGCGAPPPAPAPPVASAPAAPKAAPWSWFTDAERVSRLFVTPGQVWAVTQIGLVRWERGTGRFHYVRGEGAPSGETTSVAVSRDGTVYAGLRDGLAVRSPGGEWSHLRSGPLMAGVTALAPRTQGGVWVGLPRGLAWVEAGRLHIVSDRYDVRAIAGTPTGPVWVATHGHGVLAVYPDRLVEHTSAQGVCGNKVREVSVSADGRATAVCAEQGSRRWFSVWSGVRWTTYAVEGVPLPVESVHARGHVLIVRAGGRFWQLDRSPPVAEGAPPQPPGPRAVVVERIPYPVPSPPKPPAKKPPPEPVAKTRPAAKTPPAAPPAPSAKPPPPPPAEPSTGLAADLRRLTQGPAPTAASPSVPMPDPVPMPPHIVPPLPPPVVEEPLPTSRATTNGAGAGAPMRVRPYPTGLPAGAELTAYASTPDGTAWYAVAYRGIEAIRGDKRQRFTSLSLVPPHDSIRLSLDQQGRPLMVREDNSLLHWAEDGWKAIAVSPDLEVHVLAAAVDDAGQTWALAYKEGEKALRVFKAAGLGAFTELGRIPLEGRAALDGPPRLGGMVIDRRGRMLFPLHWMSEKGKRRGVGVGRIAPTLDRVEVWSAVPDYRLDEATGEAVRVEGPLLPTSWVNAVATAAGGEIVYVATDAGLSRVRGNDVRTIDENDFIDSEVILDVAVDPQGRAWAATLEGAGHIDQDRWVKVAAAGLDGRINAVAADARGRIWLGTETGLFRRDGAAWIEVRRAGGVAVRGVTDIAVGAGDGIWVLTTQGLLRYDGQSRR